MQKHHLSKQDWHSNAFELRDPDILRKQIAEICYLDRRVCLPQLLNHADRSDEFRPSANRASSGRRTFAISGRALGNDSRGRSSGHGGIARLRFRGITHRSNHGKQQQPNKTQKEKPKHQRHAGQRRRRQLPPLQNYNRELNQYLTHLGPVLTTLSRCILSIASQLLQ